MPPASEIPAPSIGPHTEFERDKEDPAEREAHRQEAPRIDAMGLDKRREVVGGRYSPSLAKQATLYGIAIAVIAALGFGGYLLAKEFDQPPDEYKDEAPWSQPEAANRPPERLQ